MYSEQGNSVFVLFFFFCFLRKTKHKQDMFFCAVCQGGGQSPQEGVMWAQLGAAGGMRPKEPCGLLKPDFPVPSADR